MILKPVSGPFLQLTERAVEGARRLLASQADESAKLRVLVSGGGGCADFDYSFIVDTDQNDEDHVADFAGVTILTDPISRQRLAGARIDFVEELDGSRFVIVKPKLSVQRSCASRPAH
jgi:iron-sulfur cluster insertion protein